MRFESSKSTEISILKNVKVKKMNNIIEVMALDRVPNGLKEVKKLNKQEYMLMSTGEVLKYKISENRGQNVAGLKTSFRKIRDLINNNFTGLGNELHITLTYKENMTDKKRLKLDFEKFWKKFKYKYNDAEYLSVIEPQGRGAWHCHVLLKVPSITEIFIPSHELAKMWKQGFIKVKALKGVDNIGAYLSAYLGDIELNENTENEITKDTKIKVIEKDGQKKKYIKGGRLHLYPPGMNLYRHSKGIKQPEVEKMKYVKIKEIVGSRIPNYSKTVTIYNDDGVEVNQITYEHYNLKRL